MVYDERWRGGISKFFLCQQTTDNGQQTLSTIFMSTDNRLCPWFFKSTDNTQQSTVLDHVSFAMSCELTADS